MMKITRIFLRFYKFINYHYPVERGQTLIEVLVALGIVAIVTTVLTGIVVTSLGNAKYSKDQNLASQYAQEGIEIVRSMREQNYSSFQAISSGTYCLDKNATTLRPNCSSANVDNFLRRVIVDQSGCQANVARVNVRVSWQDSRCTSSNTFCHSSELETCLSTVNPISNL